MSMPIDEKEFDAELEAAIGGKPWRDEIIGSANYRLHWTLTSIKIRRELGKFFPGWMWSFSGAMRSAQEAFDAVWVRDPASKGAYDCSVTVRHCCDAAIEAVLRNIESHHANRGAS